MASSVIGSFTPQLSSIELLMKTVHQGNPQTVTELKESIGKEITSIGSEITKPLSTVRRKGLRTVSNQEVTTLKTVVFENKRVKHFNLRILT